MTETTKQAKKLKLLANVSHFRRNEATKKFQERFSQNRTITVAIGCFLSGNSPKMNSVSKEPEITKRKACIASEVKAKTFRELHGCEETV